MFLILRVSVLVNVILWVLVEDGRTSAILQQRKTVNSGITTRLRASQRPAGGWLKEARPDSWSSHSPDPWQWALSHRMPVNPGGQWQRWWWWQVPPFWQRSIALSHTRAAENTGQKGQGRQGGVINRSHHWGTSTGKFTGHKPPRLVLSASICLVKEQQTSAVERARRGWTQPPSTDERRTFTALWIFLGPAKWAGKSWPKSEQKPWQCWGEMNQSKAVHCETRPLCRTTISFCYPISQKHSGSRKRRGCGLDTWCHLYIFLWNANNRYSGQLVQKKIHRKYKDSPVKLCLCNKEVAWVRVMRVYKPMCIFLCGKKKKNLNYPKKPFCRQRWNPGWGNICREISL